MKFLKYLAALAVLIGAMLIPASPATAACPYSCTAAEVTALQNEMFTLVNNYRVNAGRAALQRNSYLNTAAAVQSNHMVSTQTLTHVGPGGTNAYQRAVNAGYPAGRGIGENVGMGYSTSAQRVAGWYNSSSHRTIMLNSAYRYGGIAIRFGSNGIPYYALVVGT